MLSRIPHKRGASAAELSEQGRESGGNPVMTGVVPDVLRMTVEEYTSGAAVVLQASLSQAKSYLSPDDRYIATDSMLPLILSVYGGEVVVGGTTRALIRRSPELEAL